MSEKKSHPAYAAMIAAALASDIVDRKTGASKQAIEKYICAHYPVGVNFNGPLKMALKKGVETGSIIQTTGKGAMGSFKLPKAEKAKETKAKSVVKKPATEKAPPKKATLAKPVVTKSPTKPAKPVKVPKKVTSPKKPVKKVAAKAVGKVAKKASPKKAVKVTSPVKKVTKKTVAKKATKK